MAQMLSATPSIAKAPFSGQRISTVQIRGSAVIPCVTQSSMSVSLSIECSSRPKKKGTAHHNKTRPKKRQPYDKNRKGPTYYPPLPKPSKPQQDDQQPPSADAAPAASSSIRLGLPPATPVVAEEL